MIQEILGGYKNTIVSFCFSVYAFETYLNVRQHGKLLETQRPEAVQSIVTAEEFEKTRVYGLDKSYLRFVSGFYGFLQTYIFIQYDFYPIFWNFAGDTLKNYFGYDSSYEILQSILFFIIFSFVGSVFELPVSLYATFVVEQKHGFNQQTFGLFFSDFIKTQLLTYGFGAPIIAGLLYLINWAGPNFYFYAWLFMFAVQIIAIAIYPTFIQPLFNKFEPLPEGQIKTDIEALAKKIGFPLKKLFVVDGSKRSSHSNAYFFGFFKNKRIVLFDTLIEHSTVEEICAVIGHELGHWKMNHIYKMLVFNQVHLFSIFYLFSTVIYNQEFYKQFGFSSQPILIGFFLFQMLLTPVESILQFLIHIMSRKHEFEADSFAKSLGYAETLKSGLIKLQVKNKGDSNPDPWYSAYHFSHPPLVERLSAIGKTE